MKKILIALFCILISISLFACDDEVVQGPQGEKGETGAQGPQGEKGEDGVTPTISISEDGYWVINGEKTNIRAEADSSTAENSQGLAFYPKDDGTYAVAIGNAKYLSKVVIPSTYCGAAVTEIAYSGFSDCVNLVELVIPDSVTTIGTEAFHGCSGLADVHITDIAAWCNIGFGNPTSNPLYYADNFYHNDELLTELVIPDSVTSIGKYAFLYCDSLASITIPDSVTEIGGSAFTGCQIKTATIPAFAISDIPKSNLNSVVITSGESIGERAFSGCTGLTSITIPDSITSIGSSAFYNCTGLASIAIPDSVTAIGAKAFQGCSGLTSITIPDSATEIGGSAFQSCTGLTSITIPNSITSIGERAFSNCYKLVEVINNSSLNITEGSEENGYIAYYAIEVHNGESKVVHAEDYLFYTCDDVNYLFGYAGTDTALTLPESYNGEYYEIYDYSFYECSHISSITLPDSVTSIGNYAFYSCDSLASITIPDSITSIGSSAFYNCTGFTSITIPNSVTSIGEDAFYRCSNLTIYCEAESQPAGWDYWWNDSDCPVVWGYTGEE